jgi:DMSO/TMAO reductase YedYZ molybdopterin-dependent catalytic subunit
LTLPNGRIQPIALPYLQTLPSHTLHDCYIVSTGHGTSGPFTFTGTALHSLISRQTADQPNYSQVEVISGDNFGTRVSKAELDNQPNASRPILLAWEINGRSLTRQEGAIRLIVPSETDDALRQVKWIARINICP